MTAIAKSLADAGFRVARFEFGYMASRRTSAGRKPPPRAETLMPEYVAAIAALKARGPLIIGGKSMGGRVASMIADEHHAAPACSASAIPSIRSTSPTQLRTAHLADLKTPTLIVQGTRDPFGTREEVAGYKLSKAIEILWLEDGDHDLRPRKAVSGFSMADHLKTLAAKTAAWAEKIA